MNYVCPEIISRLLKTREDLSISVKILEAVRDEKVSLKK